MRWRIIRTLLYKEALRYRYNWGLLALVIGLLLLSTLVSISVRMQALPGQAGPTVTECAILHPPGSKWAEYLRAHPPGPAYTVYFIEFDSNDNPFLNRQTMAIQLRHPESEQSAASTWRATYWHYPETAAGILPYRDWFARQTTDFLGARPRFEEETRTSATDLDRTDPLPMVVTALVVFSLYLLSFNLFITSTGEERDKRILLALSLTPARAAELIGAKAIFYAAASLLVSLSVVCTHDPRILANPLLWTTITLGSMSYVAIGTIVITIIRRQTTISTVSMLYLIVTSIIMFLSQFFPAFRWVKRLLVEDYLYRQLYQILSRQSPWWVLLNQTAIICLTVGWTVVAIVFFARQGTALSKGR